MDSPSGSRDQPSSGQDQPPPRKKLIDKPWKFKDFSFSIKAATAELFATTFFVFLGCSAALHFSAEQVAGGEAKFLQLNQLTVPQTNLPVYLKLNSLISSWGVVVGMAFGIGIVVTVYNVAHISGGQVNPAVSFALFLTGNLGPVQTIANIAAQYAGATLGALLLWGITPNGQNTTLAANAVSPTFDNGNAFVGEATMTCLLVFTVLQTACDPRSTAKNVAPLAIGLSVACAHFVLIPVDGCSINPARSFGPAAVAGYFRDFWVFSAAPFVGAIVGVVCHYALLLDFDTNIGKTGKTNTVSNDNAGVSDDALRVR